LLLKKNVPKLKVSLKKKTNHKQKQNPQNPHFVDACLFLLIIKALGASPPSPISNIYFTASVLQQK